MNHRLGLGLGLLCRRLSSLGLTLVVVLLLVEYSSSSTYDREKWVNPDDMRNYDRASKTMINANKKDREWQVNEQNTDATNANNCQKDVEQENKLKEQLSSCENQLRELGERPPEYREETTKETTSPTKERQYMRRFVNVLLQALGLSDSRVDAGKTKQSTITVDVTGEHLATLRQFGSDEGHVSLGDLDDVLSQVLRSVDSGFHVLPLGWVERITHALSSRDTLYRLLPYAVTLATLSMLVMRRPVGEIAVTFLVLVLALSYQWTYDYMLKMAEVRQYAALSRHEDVPASCRSSAGWSLYEYVLRRLAGTQDGVEECRRYFAARMVEPSLEVTPTIVLSEMVSAMMLHPAAGLGAGVARFSHAILDGLPMFWNWVVLLLSFVLLAIVVIVVVVVLCGGRMRLPYLFSGLEVTGGQSARALRMEPRASLQEIRPPAPTPTPADPLVSAISSSAGGLVLMNMPVLERLMSTAPRDYVQQLVPAGGGDAAGTCCLQCGGGEGERGYEATGGRGDADRRIGTTDAFKEVKGGRDDTDRRTARTDALNEVTGGRGDADRRIARTDALNEAKGGSGKSAKRIVTPDSLNKVTERRGDTAARTDALNEAKGGSEDSDKRITSADITRQPNEARVESGDCESFVSKEGVLTTSGGEAKALRRAREAIQPDNESLEPSHPLDRSEFIDELRKILEENDDAPVTDAIQAVGATSVVDNVGPTPVDTLESLLQECTSAEPTDGVGRKVSSDSSDASSDFVKL